MSSLSSLKMPKRKPSSVLLSNFILRRKVPKKYNYRIKVLKMLAVMETQQIAGSSSNGGGTTSTPLTPDSTTMLHAQEFLSTGRTGRRNALPDILGEHALVSSSDLPARLQSLTTNEPVPGTSRDGTSTSDVKRDDVGGPSSSS